jgi:hypothetical protein
LVPAAAHILVNDGDLVKAGDALTAGPLNPHDILHIRGKDELQNYMVNQVQQVYRSQGVGIHDKHIEIILRQMLRRVQVESTGDTEYIPGQMVVMTEFQDKNSKVLAEGGEPATAKPFLLGVTRASLLTDSFLAAASFQETTRVLTQASVSGARDWLLGLKENVIIGRLIPARLDLPDLPEEQEPEALPEFGDMVPAGWLEMTAEAGNEAGAAAESFPLNVEPAEKLDPISGLLGPDEEHESDQSGNDLLGAVGGLFGDVGVTENNSSNGHVFGEDKSDA